MSEQLIDLEEAARRVPGRRRPHVSTVWRWARVGVRARGGERVRLHHVRVGARLFTTEKALRDFFVALARADEAYFDPSPVESHSSDAGDPEKIDS